MPGFFGIMGNLKGLSPELLSSSINLHGEESHFKFNSTDLYLEISCKPHSEPHGYSFYESTKNIVVFHGDCISSPMPPSQWISELQINNTLSELKFMHGVFCCAIYIKNTKRICLISDRLGIDPIYYYQDNRFMVFSTELATFCRMMECSISKEWLYEYFYFNFPIADLTPVANVFRVGPAAVMTFQNSGFTAKKYAELPRSSRKLICGQEAMDLAFKTFSSTIPNYYPETKCICGLTAGWDARLVLAFSPDLEMVSSYTYGIPGNRDIIEASKLSSYLGLKHKSLLFDDCFEAMLPVLILDSVYLSSGLNHIGRSSLAYVYTELSKFSEKHVLTGIQFDQLFRGSSGWATNRWIKRYLLNAHMDGLDEFASKSAYREQIANGYEIVQDQFGSLHDNETHLRVFLYLVGAHYFVGECKLASNYVHLRVPAWDGRIIDLAFGIEYSTLSNSILGSFNDSMRTQVDARRKRILLHAEMINRTGSHIKNLPVNNGRPAWAVKGPIAYYIDKATNKLFATFSEDRFRSKGNIPIEDNNKWINIYNRSLIDRLLFSSDSRVGTLLGDEYRKTLYFKRDLREIIKLATAEIVFRLVENGWNRNDLLGLFEQYER